MNAFPALTTALGDPPKVMPFPGVIVCANCNDRPCCCCEECGDAFTLCGHGEQPDAAVVPIDPAVLAAVQVLKTHGIDGAKYEALQKIRAAHA